MILASLDTRKFSFEAYGRTDVAARRALVSGLKRHGADYRLDSDWWEDFATDIVYREIVVGQMYRDRSPI